MNTVRVFAAALCLAGLTFGASASAQATMGGGLFQSSGQSGTKLDDPAKEGGWDALARLLQKAQPNVDTRLDPTPSQVTDRIEKLLAEKRYDEAMALIEKRQAELEAKSPRGGGDDVQFQFQRARALTDVGRTAEAEDIYLSLTTLYPELPEPWNNLAVIYVSQGNLDRAMEALNMALRSNPRDNTARLNLADVQLMVAQRTYRQAGREPTQLPSFNPDAPASTGK